MILSMKKTRITAVISLMVFLICIIAKNLQFLTSGYLSDFYISILVTELFVFFSMLSFLLLPENKKSLALSTSIMAVVTAVIFLIINPYGIIVSIYPLILGILLVIYTLFYGSEFYFLFPLVTSLLGLFYNFRGNDNQWLTAIYLFGFLSKPIIANLTSGTTKKTANLTSALDALEKFAQLKEQGILTEEEFEAKKQELMNQM